MNRLVKAVSKCPSNVESSCGVCLFEKLSWLHVNTAEVGIFSSISDERRGLFCCGRGGCREYRQVNFCNLFTGP